MGAYAIRQWWIWVLMGLVCLGYTGCKTTQTSDSGPAGEAQMIIGPENLEQICGMQWILKEMVSRGKAIPLEKEVPYVEFKPEGKLSGFGSVNRFFGSFSFDKEGGLKLSPMGTTMMAGPQLLMDQEQTFLQAFQNAKILFKQGIFLTAKASDGQTRLVFYVPVQ